MLVYARTKEVDEVEAVAEPAGGLLPRVVDAVAGEVRPERRQQQVVVVPGVRLRVAQHVQRRGQLAVDQLGHEAADAEKKKKKATGGGDGGALARWGHSDQQVKSFRRSNIICRDILIFLYE